MEKLSKNELSTLKFAVKNAVLLGRKYYDHNLTDLDEANAVLKDFSYARELVNKCSTSVYKLMEHCTYFYLSELGSDNISRPLMTLSQVYGAIKFITFIDLTEVD